MTLSTTALAQYDAPKLAAALERAQARIRQLEQENSALHTELRWIDRLLAVPASIMSPSHKVTLRAAVKACQQGTPDRDGLVQIESWKLCKTVGQSKQTFLDNLTYCAEKLGILTKKRERLVDSDTNDYTTNLYIGVTPLLAYPNQYKVDQPRNHGGERLLCSHCQSDRLQRKVTLTCMNCGSVLDEKINLVNQGSHLDVSPDEYTRDSADTQNSERNVNLMTTRTNALDGQLDASGEMTFQEPATPPVTDVGHCESGELVDSNDDPVPLQEQNDDHPQGQRSTQADVLAAAARLLVDIAGPEPLHIEMSSRGPKKYYPVNRAITVQDARAHLKGWKTKGAYLRHPGGMTRALCYDADTPDDWEALLDAARLLAEVGYQVIVEDSPAGRGGHLWLIYTRLVNAAAAQCHAAQVAPMLQQIKECWPGPGSNRVRLPGGKYVKPGFAAWCKLHDAHGARIAEDGLSAARVLLEYQTPAELIPASTELQEVLPPVGSLAYHFAPPTETESEPGATPAELIALPNNDVGPRTGQDLEQQAPPRGEHPITTSSSGKPPSGGETPGVDHHWHEKYNRHLWFHFTPAQLAAWYNERHQVEDILYSFRREVI